MDGAIYRKQSAVLVLGWVVKVLIQHPERTNCPFFAIQIFRHVHPAAIPRAMQVEDMKGEGSSPKRK